MTDITAPTTTLNASHVAGDTLEVFFSRIFRLSMIVWIPLTIARLPSAIDEYSALLDPQMTVWGTVGFGSFSLMLYLAILVLAPGFLAHAAYDAKRGRPIRAAGYAGALFRSLFPLVICTIAIEFVPLTIVVVAGLLVGSVAGLVMLVPAAWLILTCVLTVPAIVIDREGFGAFARSAELTRGHRLQILGSAVLVGICAGIPMVIVTIASASNVVAAIGPIAILATSVGSIAIALGFSSLGVLYARLCEMEEMRNAPA